MFRGGGRHRAVFLVHARCRAQNRSPSSSIVGPQEPSGGLLLAVDALAYLCEGSIALVCNGSTHILRVPLHFALRRKLPVVVLEDNRCAAALFVAKHSKLTAGHVVIKRHDAGERCLVGILEHRGVVCEVDEVHLAVRLDTDSVEILAQIRDCFKTTVGADFARELGKIPLVRSLQFARGGLGQLEAQHGRARNLVIAAVALGRDIQRAILTNGHAFGIRGSSFARVAKLPLAANLRIAIVVELDLPQLAGAVVDHPGDALVIKIDAGEISADDCAHIQVRDCLGVTRFIELPGRGRSNERVQVLFPASRAEQHLEIEVAAIRLVATVRIRMRLRLPGHFVDKIAVLIEDTYRIALAKAEALGTVRSFALRVKHEVIVRLDPRALRELDRLAAVLVINDRPSRNVHRLIGFVVQLHPVSRRALGVHLVDSNTVREGRLRLRCGGRWLRCLVGCGRLGRCRRLGGSGWLSFLDGNLHLHLVSAGVWVGHHHSRSRIARSRGVGLGALPTKLRVARKFVDVADRIFGLHSRVQVNGLVLRLRGALVGLGGHRDGDLHGLFMSTRVGHLHRGLLLAWSRGIHRFHELILCVLRGLAQPVFCVDVVFGIRLSVVRYPRAGLRLRFKEALAALPVGLPLGVVSVRSFFQLADAVRAAVEIRPLFSLRPLEGVDYLAIRVNQTDFFAVLIEVDIRVEDEIAVRLNRPIQLVGVGVVLDILDLPTLETDLFIGSVEQLHPVVFVRVDLVDHDGSISNRVRGDLRLRRHDNCACQQHCG